MNPDAFISSERGRPRRALEGYWAFHPAALPRQVDLDPSLLKLLDDATGAVHHLGGLGRLVPTPHLLIAPHLHIEAVLSSRIEGTETNVQDLLRFEVGEQLEPDAADDAREVRNYITAMGHGLARLDEGFPVSVRLLREMHCILLQGVRGHYRHPGELRRSPNWIGGTSLQDAIFVPPPPDEMQVALTDWEHFLHEDELPLLIQLALAHYQFEVIHPFLDGNGRIGRLLIPLMLVLRRALPQPLLYLSAYFERNRAEYYDHLLFTSQRGDLKPWLRFFLRGVQVQAHDAEERTVRLVELQRGMRAQLLEEKRPNSVVRLGEHLFAKPVVTVRHIVKDLQLSAPTARMAIRALVDRGDLIEVTGRERGRVYEARDVLAALYQDVDSGSGAKESALSLAPS